MNILIVDSSAMTRRLIFNALMKAEITGLIEASSGREALKVLPEKHPGVIILGFDLGDMRGVELAVRLRQMEFYRHLPILQVSERCMQEDVLDAVEAGVDHYIIIPFDYGSFVQKVRAAIERSQQFMAKQKVMLLSSNKNYSRRRVI